MEGSLFIPPHLPSRRAEQVCAECGQRFRPQGAADGEEICELCYEAHFEPVRLRHWQRSLRSHHTHVRG